MPAFTMRASAAGALGEPRRAEQAGISPAASILLDAVRFAAAIAVVVDHASLPEFRIGTRDRQIFGLLAVPVFFFLSGFVIRHVVTKREHTLREYLVDRATRIYSVAVPAMLVSMLVGALCYGIDRHGFLQHWAGTFQHPIVRIVINLLFLSQVWGLDTTPFLNVPFWSLGYECLYYLLFGSLVFLRGRARVLVALCLAVVAGPQVLLLSPVWFMGCAIYDVYQRLRFTRVSRLLGVAVPLLAVATVIGYATGHPGPLRWLWMALMRFAALPNPVSLTGLPVKHATMLALGAGLASAPALLLLLLAVDSIRCSSNSPAARWTRRIADGTFVLYLFHYPMLVLATFLGLLRPGAFARDIATVAAICVVLVAFAPVLDRLKRTMRRRLLPPSKAAVEATASAGSRHN